ncbi:MAG: hypothetical protein EBZ78_10705, partial [Verrucomicrobia bacterium]|nr:hypothetical protein [Verrucomicrobiota bacterium]
MSGGDVTFGTLTTASGLASTTANVIFNGVATLGAGNTGTTLNKNVTLSGATINSAGTVALGDTAGDVITLNTGLVTLTGSGAYTVNGAMTGAQRLALQGAGTKTFVSTADVTGFTQDALSGTVTFQDNVTTSGVSVFAASTVLDGMTFTANGAGVLGATTMNGVTLSTGLVTLAGAGNYTVNGAMTGSQVLTLNDAGTKTFASTANIAGFAQVDGTGMATFQGNVTTSGASTFNSLVTLSGMTFSAGGLTILGNAAGDTITLNTGMVTLGGSGAYISNGVMTGAQALTLAGNNSKTFNCWT